MISPAKTSRENKMLTVMKLSNEDMSISAACKEVGVSRSAFYNFCTREPEAIQAFQEMLTQSSRISLLEALIARTNLVHKLIQIALADETKPMERVAIFNTTERLLDKLLRYMRMEGGDPEAAAEVLSGPILVPGVSRLTPENQTVVG
jgi:hypothetical protein